MAENMNLVNLTPHALTVIISDNEQIQLPASGEIARVSQTQVPSAPVAGIPVTRTVYGEVTGLPAPAENTVYIVSSMVAQAITGRDDVLAPGDLVRDSDGKPVGCKGLKRV